MSISVEDQLSYTARYVELGIRKQFSLEIYQF